jgi:hypothetical protein
MEKLQSLSMPLINYIARTIPSKDGYVMIEIRSILKKRKPRIGFPNDLNRF